MPVLNNFIYNLKRAINPSRVILNNNGEFARRIQHRHTTFWKSSDAGIYKNVLLTADQPLDKWREGKYWQKKLSNKYNSREFAKMHGCKVADLYWKGRDIESLDFAQLPDHYVIRPTKGDSCSLVFLMSGAVNLMDQQELTPAEIKATISDALAANRDLEFLVEEFVRTEDGEYNIPVDYKIYMFNGEVAIIEVINRISRHDGFVSYYDTNWKMVKKIITGKYPENTFQEPPRCLDEILAQAKELSKAYEIFVRIDFYATDRGAVFGEFTPTPGASNYLTVKNDKLLTGFWDKYCKGMI